MRRSRLYLLVSLLVMLQQSSVSARPGDLRRSFGRDGVIVMDNDGNNDYFGDLVAGPGFQLTVATLGWRNGVFKAFYNGSFDLEFGDMGFFEGSGGQRLVAQNDGKFLVGDYYALVRRIDADGNLDSTFNFSLPARYTGFLTADVLVQPDGKILVLGQEREENSPLEVHRLLSDGAYDVSFGEAGIFTTHGVSGIMPSRLALQSDGKIIITASKMSSTSSQFFVGRLNDSGSWDTGFGSDGTGYTQITFRENRNERVGYVQVQSDGKIIVSGGVWLEDLSAPKYLAVARLNRNGLLDTRWNSIDRNGKLIIPTNFIDAAMIYKTLIQPDGKILYVASDLTTHDTVPFELSRLRSDGSFDTSFGSRRTGRVLEGGRLGSALDISWDDQCSLIVGGNTDYDLVTGDRTHAQNIFLARFESGLELWCSLFIR